LANDGVNEEGRKEIIMEQKELLLVLHNNGGMREFALTGVYPDYLEIESTKYNKVWNRRKLIDGKGKGGLSINKKPLYFFEIKKGCLTILDTNNNPVQFEMIQRLSD
jgi:hypothetical protein